MSSRSLLQPYSCFHLPTYIRSTYMMRAYGWGWSRVRNHSISQMYRMLRDIWAPQLFRTTTNKYLPESKNNWKSSSFINKNRSGLWVKGPGLGTSSDLPWNLEVGIQPLWDSVASPAQRVATCLTYVTPSPVANIKYHTHMSNTEKWRAFHI